MHVVAWFKKHLNLFLLFLSVTTLTLGLLISEIILYFYHIPIGFINRVVISHCLTVVLTITIAIILSSLGYLWYLKRKNRSFAFLLLFVFPVILTLVAVFSHLNGVIFFISLVYSGYIFFINPFTTLMQLANKSSGQEETKLSLKWLSKFIDKTYSLFSKLFKRHVRLAFHITWGAMIIILVVSAFITSNSYLDRGDGYNTYTYVDHYTDQREELLYTFEYPRSYYEPVGSDVIVIGELLLERAKRNWFIAKDDSVITIHTWKETESISALKYSPIDLCIFYFIGNHGLGISNISDPRIVNKNINYTTVSDIPAIDISLTISDATGDNFLNTWGYYIWGTARFVCLKYKENSWIISVIHFREENQSADPEFEHLLETFKFLN